LNVSRRILRSSSIFGRKACIGSEHRPAAARRFIHGARFDRLWM